MKLIAIISDGLHGGSMKRERYDIHLGCASAVVNFFIGLTIFILAIGFVVYMLLFG